MMLKMPSKAIWVS